MDFGIYYFTNLWDDQSSDVQTDVGMVYLSESQVHCIPKRGHVFGDCLDILSVSPKIR